MLNRGVATEAIEGDMAARGPTGVARAGEADGPGDPPPLTKPLSSATLCCRPEAPLPRGFDASKAIACCCKTADAASGGSSFA